MKQRSQSMVNQLNHEKKICFVATVPETFFYFLQSTLPALRLAGYKVTLISSSGSWIDYQEVISRYQVEYRVVPLKREWSVFADTKALFCLYLIFRKYQPGVVHASTPKAALLSIFAGWLAQVPFRIYSVRGLIAYGKTLPARFVLHWMERLVCSLAHKVTFNSESNCRYFFRHQLCKASKMGIFGKGSGQGVDASVKFNPANIDHNAVLQLRESIGISQNAVIFGFVGRLVRDKGVEDLAAAWEIFSKDRPTAILLVIGPEKEPRDNVSAETLRILKTTPSIKFVGHAKDPVVHYAAMDVLVLPSYREGFPNVVLEAYAMGKPVITTDAPGCVDAIKDNETGFMIPVGDVTALCDGMRRLHDDPALRKRMGGRGRALVLEKYRPEFIVDDLLYLYERREFRKRLESNEAPTQVERDI